jgi:putative methyltransferase (TIGR04325 family)
MEFKEFVPPALKKYLIRLGLGGNRFSHGYRSWEEASRHSAGYDSNVITQQLVAATRKVRDGDAPYERDGVVFREIEYSWPLLAALLATPREGRVLRILDWGGSLGSTFRQNKAFLELADIDLRWVVVEQPHLVAIGDAEFTTEQLKFQGDLSGYKKADFDVAIFASSIGYVPNAEDILSSVTALGPKRLIFDRTPEANGQHDLFGVQKVGSRIYEASYPIRSFGRGKIESMLAPNYTKLLEWECELQPDPQTVSKGYLFCRSDVN